MVSEEEILNVIKEGITTAGLHIKRSRLENLATFSRAREDRGLLNRIEKEAEIIIVDSIHSAFGDTNHRIFAEFGKVSTKADYTWVIDAIDGKSAFLRANIANVAMSIACVYRGREIVAAGVYNPFLDLLYTATKNSQTLINDQEVLSEEIDWMSKSRMIVDFSDELPEKIKRKLINMELDGDIKRMYLLDGSISQQICLIINGSIHGAFFWGIGGKKGNYWDIAAVQLLCNRAGIGMTDFSGKSFSIRGKVFDQIVVASHPLHSELLSYIKNTSKKK